MPHASTVAAGSRTLPAKWPMLLLVMVYSSDEFSSDGEVKINSEEPTSMLQKLRAPKVSDLGRNRKLQCNSHLEASIMLQFNHR